MNIFICASKHCYHYVPKVREQLEVAGHTITLPNSFDDPGREARMQEESAEKHADFKGQMLKKQVEKIKHNDAILVLNYEKNGVKNYIGGATFLEIFKAFELGKKVYLMNPIPGGMLYDEICGMKPEIIEGDLSKLF